MRLISILVVLLAGSSVQASEYELIYFTQNHEVCPPCIPVSKMVDELIARFRAITISNYQIDDSLFQKYSVEVTPSFILLKNGQIYRRYVQDDQHRFTFSMLQGIAPPASEPANCAKPVEKVIRNGIPPPPPPTNSQPADVPDREKVARIEVLERLVRDQQLVIHAMKSEIAGLIKTLPTATDGKDGIDGKDGADGIDGKDGAAISSKSLSDIAWLRAEVEALRAMKRRFLIVEKNKILGDLTYDAGEPVVIDRQIILSGGAK